MHFSGLAKRRRSKQIETHLIRIQCFFLALMILLHIIVNRPFISFFFFHTILRNLSKQFLKYLLPLKAIHFCRAFFDPIPVFIRHFDYCVDGYLAAKGKTDVISIF